MKRGDDTRKFATQGPTLPFDKEPAESSHDLQEALRRLADYGSSH
jgi:hypothetical protein